MEKKIKLMHPYVGDEEIENVKDVIYSGNLVEGKYVRAFEQKAAEYIDVKYAIACTSATTGLELALRALDIGKGDEVIVPSFTHPATALAVMTVGANPVIVDVDRSSYTISVDHIISALSRKTKVVIPVSIFGYPVDMYSILELRKKHDFYIIEDAACSLGSEYKNKKVGSLADISVFSFHPRKIFTTGDGGLVVTNNQTLSEKINSIKKFGIRKMNDKIEFAEWGTNYRMSDILGAVAYSQILKIEKIVNERIRQAMYYNQLVSKIDKIELPVFVENCKINYQSYAIYLMDSDRDKIIQEMAKAGIETQIGTNAIHLLPVFKNVKKVSNMDNSRLLYKNVIVLPMHSKLTSLDQEFIIDTLKDLL